VKKKGNLMMAKELSVGQPAKETSKKEILCQDGIDFSWRKPGQNWDINPGNPGSRPQESGQEGDLGAV